MIVILFSTIFIISVLAGWGKVFENIWGTLFHGISGKILSGILGISLIWTLISFFYPLDIYLEVIFIALGLFFFFKNQLYLFFYRFSKNDGYLLAFMSGIILLAGSYYPYILDHFGYYIPSINWLTEYGLTKGISNLDLTLGQMSLWHIFQAGFSNFSDPYLRINTLLLVIYTFYIIERKNWISFCFIPVLLLFSQSPSPDLPAIIFSLIILQEIIAGNKNTVLLFAFAVFAFAIKPTILWLPIMVFLYSIFISKSNSKNLIFGTLILFLFFIKNIWTFGYPIFPVAIGDWGFSWKPDAQILKTSAEYAIRKTYDMQYSYEEIQKFSIWEHIKNWLLLKGIKSKINILFLISLLIFTTFVWIKKNKIITIIYFSLLIKSIFTLAFSAQYRFFIDVFFVLFFVIFYEYFNKRKSIIIFSVLSIILISALTFPTLIQQYIPSFRLGSFMAGFEKEQLYKPSTYQYRQFKTYKIGNLKFHVSKNYPYNFDTPLPAISASFVSEDIKAGVFPQLSDKNDIKKGFITRKLSCEEKKEAASVINNIKNTDK
ncbi:hypothetical protein C1631_009125 [Chryseobacterium phosphatilyticum]|uniref:DUF8201 domain-containing protein n=1 Tax=Chryseobacterium phosphatilyticum TaxID=475075 RepID=A0A316XD22_9FLAO|nr:hypothetical protein [Chryseobacterium phosphatilyticum]PWN70143.1 hypothetical protein C1631_009125 [Chryseobacterium phosphatilyticum]